MTQKKFIKYQKDTSKVIVVYKTTGYDGKVRFWAGLFKTANLSTAKNLAEQYLQYFLNQRQPAINWARKNKWTVSMNLSGLDLDHLLSVNRYAGGVAK